MDDATRQQITELGMRCEKAIREGDYTPDHSTVLVALFYIQNLEMLVNKLQEKLAEDSYLEDIEYTKVLAKTDLHKQINATLQEELLKGFI